MQAILQRRAGISCRLLQAADRVGAAHRWHRGPGAAGAARGGTGPAGVKTVWKWAWRIAFLLAAIGLACIPQSAT
jgi:hypothetical protein